MSERVTIYSLELDRAREREMDLLECLVRVYVSRARSSVCVVLSRIVLYLATLALTQYRVRFEASRDTLLRSWSLVSFDSPENHPARALKRASRGRILECLFPRGSRGLLAACLSGRSPRQYTLARDMCGVPMAGRCALVSGTPMFSPRTLRSHAQCVGPRIR